MLATANTALERLVPRAYEAAAAPGAKVSFQLLAEVPGADGGLVARTRADYRLRPLARR